MLLKELDKVPLTALRLSVINGTERHLRDLTGSEVGPFIAYPALKSGLNTPNIKTSIFVVQTGLVLHKDFT